MLIKSITLKNFRQYKGINTINFSIDKEKNVTVIIGENTCGKTTLVQAFIWCLYGRADFKDKRILNAEVRDELVNNSIGTKKDALVRVCLIHNDITYLIERKEISKVNENTKISSEQTFKIYEMDVYNGAIPLENSDYETIISDILPENLSEYFFFWGERIEKLSEKKELSAAVKQFLGLDTIDSAIKHLTTVVSRLIKEAGSGIDDAEIAKYNQKIQELEIENERIREEIDSYKNNIAYFQKTSDDLFAILTTSENQELQAKQNKFKNESNELEAKKSKLEKLTTSFSKNFNDTKNYIYLFANTSEKKGIELLKRNPEPIIGWNYIDLNAINEIIKRGKCICGNEFHEGDETYSYLIEQRKLVAPNVIGGVINSFIEEAERREMFNQDYYKKIHDNYREIIELNEEIEELEKSVEDLKRYITGKRNLDDVNQRYHEINAKINDFKKRQGGREEAIKNNEDKIAGYSNAIRVLMEKNKKYSRRVKAISYAQRVLDIFKEDYTKNESILKSKLEEYVNKYFEEAYSGDRKIQIDEKYNAIALNKVGDNWISSESSPGLETVKNFAFIAGLVQCAKEKIIGSDGTETEANSNSYPLVLDAPFFFFF